MVFTQDWAGLDSTMSSSRSAKLQPLQKMAEMQEFLEFIAQEGNIKGNLCVEIAPPFLVINKWRTCTPQVLLLEGTRLVDLFLFFTENFSSTNAAESMFNKWSYRFPDPRLHPIVVWDDIVTNRYRSEGCADPDQLITWGHS